MNEQWRYVCLFSWSYQVKIIMLTIKIHATKFWSMALWRIYNPISVTNNNVRIVTKILDYKSFIQPSELGGWVLVQRYSCALVTSSWARIRNQPLCICKKTVQLPSLIPWRSRKPQAPEYISFIFLSVTINSNCTRSKQYKATLSKSSSLYPKKKKLHEAAENPRIWNSSAWK